MSQGERGLTERTLGGLLWTFLGTGAQVVLQVLVVVVLARLLTPTDFGVVAAALVVIGFSAIFSHLGVGPAVVQRPGLQEAHLRTAFTISLFLGLLFAGLLWLLAPAVAAFFRMEALTPVLRVLALVFPLQGLAVVAESLLQRELRFRWLAVTELAAVALGYGGVGITLAALGLGIWALVAGHLAQVGLRTVLFLAGKPHPLRPLLDWKALSELLYFGGGHTAARLSNYLAIQGDNLIVGRFLGAAALGAYGRAYQLMTAPAVLVGQVLDKVLFPTMAKVQDQPGLLAEAYRRGVALIALLVLPGAVVVCLLAPELVHVLLGPQWDAVVVPFQILAAGMLFRTSYKMSDSLARATGAVYRRAWRQVIYAALVLGGALAGQAWGLPGVAAGVVIALAGNFLLMAHLGLSLTALSWRGFLAAHLPGAALAALAGLQVAAVATMLRGAEAAPFVVLLASAVAVLPTLLLVRWAPQLFLGQDGRWMLRKLMTHLTRTEQRPCPGGNA